VPRMQVGQKVTDDYMVAAFVKAEIDSPRFGAHYRQGLAAFGKRRSIVDSPNMLVPHDNWVRRQQLRGVRGYEANAYLFAGFPTPAAWHMATVTPEELKSIYYANHPTWTTLSQGSRLVADGAANVFTVQTNENTHVNIPAVAERVRGGETFPELLCVSTDPDGPVVIFEGHTRATAYVLAGEHCPDPVRLLIGFSTSMTSWLYFGTFPKPADEAVPAQKQP
jgi:hypothetical protein